MLLFRQFKWSAFWTLVTILLSTLIIVNTSTYFQSGTKPPFLVEKGPLAQQPLWRAALYFHVASACISLAAGAALMFPQLLRYRNIHFLLGYIYLNSVLWIAAPTGLILAVNAKWGLLAGVGFGITGIFWWAATWIGYRAIRKHRVESHIKWMIRSYALALSAPAFRVIHLMFELASMEYRLNYILSVWLSLLVSIALSETCILKNLKSKKHGLVQNFNFQKGNRDEPLFGHPILH